MQFLTDSRITRKNSRARQCDAIPRHAGGIQQCDALQAGGRELAALGIQCDAIPAAGATLGRDRRREHGRRRAAFNATRYRRIADQARGRRWACTGTPGRRRSAYPDCIARARMRTEARALQGRDAAGRRRSARGARRIATGAAPRQKGPAAARS